MILGITSGQGKQPDAATSVSASAGNGQATVSFTLPVYDGKGVATYQVVSDPQAIYVNGASSPITITGLSNGTAYTFTVLTVCNYGVSTDSASSNSVTPVAPPPPPPPPPPGGGGGPPPPPNCCPSGGGYSGGYCYYNCGSGSTSCGCGPGYPSGYVDANTGQVDCIYPSPCG